eukprot:436146_1
MILHHFTSVFLSSTFVMASNNNNLLPNRSTYPTLPPYLIQFRPPVSYPIQRQFQPVSYPIQIQQPIGQQIHTISNQYPKKRDASHLSGKQPSKRQKLNHAFNLNQHDIIDYKNYVHCILRIIQRTIEHHEGVKKDYKRNEINGGDLLGIKNLRKCARILEKAYICDPTLTLSKLHFPDYHVLCNAINKVLHHIPVPYQEKVVIQSGDKAIFDKYISNKDISSDGPNILRSFHKYYEYTGGNIMNRHCKNIKKQIPKKPKKQTKKLETRKKKSEKKIWKEINESLRIGSLEQKLHDMTEKYDGLLLRSKVKIRVQNKEIEQLKKDKKIQEAVIDGLNACINAEKDTDINAENKDVIINILNIEKDVLQQEINNLREENFELKQIINDLELKHYLVSWEKSIKLNENSNNIEDIKIKKELNIENNNDFDEECIDYCEDNDIDDIIVTNDNLNDGIVRILNDNININWCPKCGS